MDLVKHHGVLVTKAGLSRILLNGANDPAKLVRAALIELYGTEALKKMAGTKSLQTHVRAAIQGNKMFLFPFYAHIFFWILIFFYNPFIAFVESNTTAEARSAIAWSQSTMTRIMNQKSSGLRHKSKRYLFFLKADLFVVTPQSFLF